MQLRTIIFLNRTTFNLDGAISYVYKSNTTFGRATAKPLDRKSWLISSFTSSVPSKVCKCPLRSTTRHLAQWNLILARLFQI